MPQVTRRHRTNGRTLIEQLVNVSLAAADAERVRGVAGRSLFDYRACLEAGRRLRPELPDAACAAFLDRDDLHRSSVTHPGAIIWSVVNTCGGDNGAAAAGYEATARIGVALGPEHRKYWHATATAGSIGAALTAGLALDLSPEQLVDCAAHAVSVAGGSVLAVIERSGSRLFHRAHAAATGIAAARAAATGLGGTRTGLEAEQGFFAALGGSCEGLVVPRDRLAIEETELRIHATNGFAQELVEAARQLAPVTEDVHVIVTAPKIAVALAGNENPRSPAEAWWSLQYAVAVTLLGLDLEDKSLVSNHQIRRLLSRTELREGEAGINVDGRMASPSPNRVPTDIELIGKWQALNPLSAPPVELLA